MNVPDLLPRVAVADYLANIIRLLGYEITLKDLQATPGPPPPLPDPGPDPIPEPEPQLQNGFITPGAMLLESTLCCVSVRLQFTGDANSNATATLMYRRTGTTVYRNALDPVRVSHTGQNRQQSPNFEETRTYIAGSIFNLSPGTQYDIQMSVIDPDGIDGNSIINGTITTRAMPAVSGRIIEVTTSTNLANLEDGAFPGDTYLLHAGDYGPWTINVMNGVVGNHILVTPFGDGVVNFSRIDITSDYIWLDGVSLGSGSLNGSVTTNPTGIVITRLTITGSGSSIAIDADGSNWTILDCTTTGTNTSYPNFSGEGIEFGGRGRGHVAAYNSVSATADCYSYGDGHIDVHNNRFFESTDDFMEPDFGWDNMRMWANRCYSTLRINYIMSSQPISGGPWYLIRNQSVGQSSQFKFGTASSLGDSNGETGARFIIGNTFESFGGSQNLALIFRDPDMAWCNNFIIIRPDSGQREVGNSTGGGSIYLSTPSVNRRLWGYNRYQCNVNNVFDFDRSSGASGGVDNSIIDMQDNYGVEFNSFQVTASDVVSNLPTTNRTGQPLALIPIVGQALIDGGAHEDQLRGLDNVLGAWVGIAPDVGAHQSGLGENWVGPRSHVAGLAYGDIGNGWAIEDISNLGNYTGLGLPSSVSDGRLLFTRVSPIAAVVVFFVMSSGEERWIAHNNILNGAIGDTVNLSRVNFRDGFGATVVTRGSNVNVLGSRVDIDGVMNIVCGVATGDYSQSVQDDMMTLIQSLWYSWSL